MTNTAAEDLAQVRPTASRGSAGPVDRKALVETVDGDERGRDPRRMTAAELQE